MNPVHAECALDIRQLFRLVEIAHETPNLDIRTAALAVFDRATIRPLYHPVYPVGQNPVYPVGQT